MWRRPARRRPPMLSNLNNYMKTEIQNGAGLPLTPCSLLFGDLVVTLRTATKEGKPTEISSILKGVLTDKSGEAQSLVENEIPLLLTAVLRAVRELNVPVRWGKDLAPPIDGKTRTGDGNA